MPGANSTYTNKLRKEEIERLCKKVSFQLVYMRFIIKRSAKMRRKSYGNSKGPTDSVFATTTTIEARSAMDKERRIRMEFDTDSFDILIDNCCSHTLTNDINDYIEPPVKSSVRVRGYNGSTNSTMVGTVKWKIRDDNGKVHNFILPNTYYSSSVETRLLSPQHWAQTRKKGRDSYCVTYHECKPGAEQSVPLHSAHPLWLLPQSAAAR